MKKQMEAIPFTRVSSKSQWNRGDHLIQKDKIVEWCKEHNLRCIRERNFQYKKHEDPFTKNTLNSLLTDISTCLEIGKPLCNLLVAVSMDRFGNEDVILNKLLPFCKDHNVGLAAIQENVNSMEDEKAFIEAVHEDNATARDTARTEATQKNRKYRLKVKRDHNIYFSQRIFGLEYKSNIREYKFRENKDAYGNLLKEIYIGYVYDHMTLRQIQAMLNETKIKPLRAIEWSAQTIANILKNRAFVDGITRAGFKCPKIIPEHVSIRATNRLSIEKGGRSKIQNEPLRKLVYCGHCKNPMTHRKNRKGIRWYSCKNCKVRKDEGSILEEAINQAKTQLDKILADKIGVSNLLKKSITNRIKVVFHDSDKNDRDESVRMVKNFIPFELSKKMLVYEDKIKINGMSGKEVVEELENDWLDYVGKYEA